MATLDVTVAVVPRERFSFAQRSLESVLGNIPRSTKVVYIDGSSPSPVREYLAGQAARENFELIRTEEYLSPNAARNMALGRVRTKYVAFVDNDALVSPGWLESLVDCGESTGAWVVGPVYCETEPIATRVHMAGGTAQIIEKNGRREFHEAHRHYGQSLATIAPTLRREPVEMIEFHAALVHMAAFERLGPLDEQLMSAPEHADLCLLTRAAGKEVYLEPKSVVTYVPPPPFEPYDLPYFQLRWSDAWNRKSIERFREKWQLAADDPGMVSLAAWLAGHRRLALEPYRRALRLLGRKPAKWVEKIFLAPIEQVTNRARYPHSRRTANAPS